ncbi:MAG: single-stranded-DNA-specific exonuclease RecJ [Bacteroidota bacterium]
MKAQRWTLLPYPDTEQVNVLANAINVRPAIAAILLQRGITDFEQARTFFVPLLEGLHDPFLMKDMKEAVERLTNAVNRNEKILVYGDYDVDGTTAVALMYSFISSFYPNVDYYIPDRYKEGYGISSQGVHYAHEQGFSLIIALDCGIKSIDKVGLAHTFGIDFIICDHHLPGETIPDAVAVLDPKRNDCGYPFKELCGCGVGFKLVQAFCESQGWSAQQALQYLDLVAISIAADIVPVNGENRILSHHGLFALNHSPRRPGLKALLEHAAIKRELSVGDLVFTIAPRINAAGRITSGREAVSLLVATDAADAREISRRIDDNNSIRKDLDKSITSEALDMIAGSVSWQQAKTTVVYHEDWNKGVVGIVASRLTETYYRPTIVLTRSGDKVAGSARSVRGYDVYRAIEACSVHLEQFGGHKYAAGLTLLPENIDLFREAFELEVCASITEELLQPEIIIDAALDFDQISMKFSTVLNRMSPFGPENMQPVFRADNVRDAGFAKRVGENHLKCLLYQENDPAVRFDAIGFKLDRFLPLLKSGKPFSIAYSIEQNVWNEQVALQLVIKDIKEVKN